MSLGGKLKQARKLLGDTQAVAHKKSGVPQSDISYMEVGKRKNIPEEYFFYLHQNGIDLNSLFDETKETASMQKSDEKEINELKKTIREQAEFIQLQKDAIQLRERKLMDLNVELNVVEKL